LEIGFIGGSGKSRSYAVDGQDSINYYVEITASNSQSQAKNVTVLYPTPGLLPFNKDIDLSGVVRCLYTTSTGRMFSATGNKLIEYSPYGQKTIRGTLLTNTGVVSMADCGQGAGRGYGLCIVDGLYGYNYNLTNNTFEQIKDVSFPRSGTVIFMDGYFIVNELDSARFWLSQMYDCLDWSDLQEQYPTHTSISLQTGLLTVILEDATGAPLLNLTTVTSNLPVTVSSTSSYLSGTTQVYDPTTGQLQINITSFGGTGVASDWTVNVYVAGSTRFATAEGTPDNLKTIATIRNELWLIGDISTEIWTPFVGAGPDDFPFIKSRGAFVNNGTVASYSAVTNGNNLFWLGSSAAGHGQVWMTNNYQPYKISTNSIDHEIEALSNIQDAVGFCYTQEGHEFYVLSFNEGNKTLVYDISTSEWHERAHWNGPKGRFERYMPNTHCLFNGVNYVGDYRNSKIYSLDLNTFTDDGETVRRVRTGPHVHQDRQRLYYKEFEIDIERGVGLDGNDPNKNNPMAFLTWSDDGGMTWSNEYWNKLGARGEYKNRLHWHRLGYSRDRVFRLVVTDPIKVVLIAARADVQAERQ
jgi:Phage stabilisation protein.